MLLSSMSPSKRSQYMKDAILFYAGIGNEMKQLNSYIKQMLDGDFVRMDAKNVKGDGLKEADNNDILESSLDDMFNFKGC